MCIKNLIRSPKKQFNTAGIMFYMYSNIGIKGQGWWEIFQLPKLEY